MRHYDDVLMTTLASQITSLAIVYSIVYSDADQRKHQSSASLAFVRGIHRGPVNSPHKGPVTRKMFPFDDVVMIDCLPINNLIFSGWIVIWFSNTDAMFLIMKTSSYGDIFRVTCPLCGKSAGNWWIPLTKTSDTDLWCVLSAPE